ncbi:hypothetical protein RIF29_34647 [Crotalaria pallida]|uniref:Uncharacterized protein n=1 Tax=Crotalaria pallida TaxID=3830 RepID=A0AAN9E9E7_CROPI
MGNCSFKGNITTGECHHSIRVLSDSGAILQFKGPKTVGQVLQHYPAGYGIFLQGHASLPLPPDEKLSYGLFYYLLPLKEVVQVDEKASLNVSREISLTPIMREDTPKNQKGCANEKHDREGSPLGRPNVPREVSLLPIRWEDTLENQKRSARGVSKEVQVKEVNDVYENDEEAKKVMRVAACDYVQNLSNESSALEVLPSAKNGVWRVKLVIETRQLEEILSEQVNTEALIEKMRMAATTCSTTSPTRSRIMTTWKVGWKPKLGRFTKSTSAESNLWYFK